MRGWANERFFPLLGRTAYGTAIPFAIIYTFVGNRLPTIVSGFGFGHVATGLLNVIPWLCVAAALWWVPRHAEGRSEQRWHIVGPALVSVQNQFSPAFRSSRPEIDVCDELGLAFLPWRAAGKYYHYRGMRPDIRRLARDHDFGRSLVLVSGRRHPDYASAVVYNPVDSGGAQPVYAWDAWPEIRSKVIDAYRDRPVWFVAGPSITGRGYEVTAGPLDAKAALRHGPPGGAAGDEGHVYDPVLSSPAGAALHE